MLLVHGMCKVSNITLNFNVTQKLHKAQSVNLQELQ